MRGRRRPAVPTSKLAGPGGFPEHQHRARGEVDRRAHRRTCDEICAHGCDICACVKTARPASALPVKLSEPTENTDPPPGKKKTDTVTTLNLVYSF